MAEKDPITGKKLNRLTNYNNSEPIDYRNDVDLSKISQIGSVQRTGSTGDANLYNYEASKYDNNIQPYELSNLNDIRSQNQGVFDSLGRSTANLIGKTAVNVVGGLVGTAYGAVDAIQQGRISALWDNDLTTELDKASEGIGDYFRVYKSNDYEESNMISNMFLHPIQFTDELMDTLSFTTGAVVTELISGGLASGAVIPRALKYFKTLNKASEMAEVGAELANNGSKLMRGLSNAGTLTRQLATGSAYEASVEARHAGMELRDNLYNQWLEENPNATIEDMPEDVRQDIDSRLSNAGLFTYLTNLALVGSSNIVQFPKVFGAGYNTSKRAGDLSSRIQRNAEGLFEDVATNATRRQRALSTASTFLKNPIMEGIVEEGGQGVISGVVTDFFARKYDLDSKGVVNDFLHDLGKSLIDTYTTAEGWEEIGMGMLIGSMGAPGRGALSIFGKENRLGKYGFNEDGTRREIWDGGIAGAFNERASQNTEIASYIEELNNNTSLGTAMKANYDFLVQADSLDRSMSIALQNQDTFNFNNYKDDKVHAYISSRLKAGLASDLDTTIEQLEKLTPEDMYVEFRGQEEADKASDVQKRDFKQSSIKEFKDKIKATTDAYNLVDEVYTGDNPEIRDYFAHGIASAKYLDLRERQINSQLSDLSNGAVNNINLRNSNTVSIANEISRLKELNKSAELSKEDKQDITNLINSYETVQDKQRQLSTDEYEALSRMQANDPSTLSINLNKISSLLDDSRKIRNRRQGFIDDYNNLFSEEGIKKTQKAQREFLKQEEENRKIQEAEANEIAKQQQKIDDEVKAKARKEEIKAKAEAAKIKKNEVAKEVEEDELTFTPATFEAEGSNLTNINNESDQISDEVDTEELVPETEEGLTVSEKVVANSIEYEETNQDKLVNKQDGLVRNSLEENNDEYRFADLSFKRDTGNTIISLNVNYAENVLGNTESKQDEYRIFDGYSDDGRLDINSNFDSRLQDPNQFNVGTQVNIIIPTYQQILDRGIELTGYSESEYNNDINNPEMMPIAFTDNTDKIIGYLPTVANVNRRVSPDYLQIELSKNRELRNFISENRDSNLVSTIYNKTSGTPMFQRNKQNIYNTLGDGNRLSDGVKIGIFKEGKLQIGLNNTNQNRIKLPDGVTSDMYFNEGLIYAIVPTAVQDEFLALNMDVNTLDTNNVNTVIKMLELYKATDKFKEDSNLLNEREQLSNEIDFTNFTELSNALNSILYINNENDNYMLRLDNNKLILGLTDDMQFTWNQFRKPEVKDKVREILQRRFYAVKLAEFGNPFTSYSLNDNNELNITRNKNYFDYLNNNNVISTNIQSEPISNKTNERYFTAQSVISIGNTKIVPKQLNTANIEASETPSVNMSTFTPEVTKTAPEKPKNKLGIKLKGNKNKPRIDEDFAEISSNDLSINEQVELLMKKCSN